MNTLGNGCCRCLQSTSHTASAIDRKHLLFKDKTGPGFRARSVQSPPSPWGTSLVAKRSLNPVPTLRDEWPVGEVCTRALALLGGWKGWRNSAPLVGARIEALRGATWCNVARAVFLPFWVSSTLLLSSSDYWRGGHGEGAGWVTACRHLLINPALHAACRSRAAAAD